jgi:chemotaxis protein MotA
VFKHAMGRFSWVIKPPPVQAEELIKKIVEWSTIARKQGLLGLEPLIEQEQDTFVKRGLQLVVDGGEPDAIRASSKSKSACANTPTRAPPRFRGHGHLLRPRSASSAPCSASWP